MNKETVLKIRESLRAGSLSEKWWKQLKKEINKCKLSKSDKIITYSCIIRGLADECYSLADNSDDLDYIVNVLKEVFNHE